MRHAGLKIGAGALAVLAASAGLFAVVMAAGGFDDPVSSETSQQFDAGNPQRQDTPNDPDYDCAELDTLGSGSCSSLYEERFDLFGFPSSLTRLTALYSDGQPQISGFNAAGAWKAERGLPEVSVAVLDTGIRWDRPRLRTKVRLNAGELPLPQNAGGQAVPDAALGGYDLNGNGAFDVDDYADDPRVDKNRPNGVSNLVDGQDLIIAFSDGSDADGNGFVDDIAGWDFFDDDNNPYDASSYFAAGNHGTGRILEAVEPGNDGDGGIGVCPKCSFVPIRIWDTFVSDGNSFGLGITYAADNGVSVIVGANGSLNHTAFTEAAVAYAHGKNVVQTYSGDDLNTGNHNYPAAYNHALLIEGTVPDTVGLGEDNAQFQQGREFFCAGPLAAMCPGSNLPVRTYFRSANTAQFGGKSSISMWGATGSQNTGRAGGAAGLVMSAGLRFSPELPLSADEARIILEQTAEDVLDANTAGAGVPDPAPAGWDSHFGWGRANLGAAVQAVKDGNIPPEASIVTPDWYAPLTGDTVSFTGVARARRHSGEFTYKMEWGPGQAPTGWTEIKSGTSTGTVTDLGSLNLAAVRSALASFVVPPDAADATFAPNSRHPLQDQFTVRLTVTVPGKMAGVDRKVLTAVPDVQPLVAGYPKRLGSGGEAPLRYADINGDNVQELIVPAQDGLIHAYQPDGSELPGWPVQTRVIKSAEQHLGAPVFAGGGVPIPREPPRGPTIADFDQDGKRQVVIAAGLHVYVFNSDGTQRAGFPVRGNDENCAPDKQRQENLHPKCGFVATPALAWINGRAQPPVIVAPSLDGNLYLWNRDGSAVAWSPRKLQDSTVAAEDLQVAESINNPAIGDLNGDGKDDIVVPTNEVYPGSGGTVPQPPNEAPDVGFSDLTPTEARVYAINGADGTFLAGWPVHVGGIIQNVLPFIGPGHDPALLQVNGEQQVVLSATGTGVPEVGSGLSTYGADGGAITLMRQDAKGPLSNITDTSGGLNLFESAVIGDLLGTGAPAVVKYQLGRAQAANLLLVGQNFPYNHMIGAWDAASGTNLPAFPTITDDYQFLSSSSVARMSSSLPTQQVLAGTGLGLVHAYDGATGLDVPGFPKVTGGWLFAPAALSDSGRMASITREGFLFVWQTNQPACQSEWPSFRHDEQGSGNYNRDGTPPGAITNLMALRDPGPRLEWIATGGDGASCGSAASYRLLVDGAPYSGELPAPAAPGTAQEVALTGVSDAEHRVTLQAVDATGNVGYPVSATLPAAAAPPPPAGVIEMVAPATAGAAPGATVSAGSFQIRNPEPEALSLASVRVAVSNPDVFSSITIRSGGSTATASFVTANTELVFDTPVSIAGGASAAFEASAQLTPATTADAGGTAVALEFSLANRAHAGGGAAPGDGNVLAAMLALALMVVLASRRRRVVAHALLGAVLMLAACGSDDPAPPASNPVVPDPTSNPVVPEPTSSTVDLSAASATTRGQAVVFSGLPARLANITRQP